MAKGRAHTPAMREYHVATKGNDGHEGTISRPLRSISAAASRAHAGDTITVHEGTYRERVAPPRGGTSDANRIVYRAAPGEHVIVSGAEPVKGWVRLKGDAWKVTVPNSMFGKFNPYSDVIHGDWFSPNGRVHHTGAVYLNSDWLAEAAKLDDVFEESGETSLWYGEVGDQATTLWAQFRGVDPNEQQTEINVRQTVFYPEVTGINYITVKGFVLCRAAAQWAPPTAEQAGVIGPHWSKGWIIENNVIRNSICSGISLGKYGDQWDNTSANSAQGYVKTIQHALADGWTREQIGHHIVRNNTISDCGQTGIVGSLGAAFSTVTGNTIHDIHVRRLFGGAEIAGIKFHGAIDVQISHNQIDHTPLGLWLDWMAQGTRVSGNLFHDNDADIFVEVDHGPFLIDNNLLLSSPSLRDNSQGGAYVHNLFAGAVRVNSYDGRQTPFMEAHSTALAGLHDNPRGDDRFYNNLFIQHADLSAYDNAPLPMLTAGNVFLDGAKPSRFEEHPLVIADSDPGLRLIEKSGGLYLEFKFVQERIDEQPHKLITSALLGRAVIPDLPYDQPDSSPIRIDTDYMGKTRSESNPTPGPFERPGQGDLTLKVR